jgi:hypothetical protein
MVAVDLLLFVVTSNFGAFPAILNSNGLNCSRIPSKATFFPTLFSLFPPFCAFSFRCFFDCWGPTSPCSRKDALSLLSWEGGIFAGKFSSSPGSFFERPKHFYRANRLSHATMWNHWAEFRRWGINSAALGCLAIRTTST